MKITKRQLRRIIKEAITTVSDEEFDKITMPGYKGPQPMPAPGTTGDEIQPSIDAIEEILNGLYEDGLENPDLIKLLEDIIGSINAGFVGEPT